MGILKYVLKKKLRKAYEKSKIEKRNKKLQKLQTENLIREEKLKKAELKQDLKKLPWYKRL